MKGEVANEEDTVCERVILLPNLRPSQRKWIPESKVKDEEGEKGGRGE